MTTSSSSFAPASHFLTALPRDTFLACGFRDSPHISRVQKYMASHLFSMAPSGGTPAHARSPVSKLEGGFAWKFIARSFVVPSLLVLLPIPLAVSRRPSLQQPTEKVRLGVGPSIENVEHELGRREAAWLSKQISTRLSPHLISSKWKASTFTGPIPLYSALG